VYCAVSQPTYNGQDMELADLPALISMLKARRIQTLVVNSHGETTFIPDWHHRIMARDCGLSAVDHHEFCSTVAV
jgi:hypothetical protein